METATQTRERILVIEDEDDIREIVDFHLQREGYRVSLAADGEVGLELVRREFPDLILLDLMLPGMDGVELCKRLKSDPDLRAIPVIMVTAKGDVDDVIEGLEAGADDYLSKPFSPRELVARVKAVVRRGSWDDSRPRERIVYGGLIIHPGRHEVRLEGEPVQLTATEFKLLHQLASNPGRVFSRAALLTRVLGSEAAVIDRNIDVHVGAIRRKLGEYRDLVETVRGVGYRFKAL